MKKWLCVLCCAALLLPVFTCALGEEAAAEFSTATALKAFLPTVDWDDYTAKDTDGDGFDDEIMISYNANGAHGRRYHRRVLPVHGRRRPDRLPPGRHSRGRPTR